MPQTDIGTSDRILAELRGWVEHETPTTDAGAVNGLLDRCQAELRRRRRGDRARCPAATATATR